MTEVIEKKKIRKISITIDGKSIMVPEGITILEAARKAGIYIPTLCYLDNLPPYGGCRLCLVEVKNLKGYQTACTTPVSQGMEIITKTADLQILRRDILELILSEHTFTCLICKDKNDCSEYMHSTRKVGVTTGCNFCTSNGDCELQNLVEHLELEDVRFPIAYRGIEPVKDNPFYELDYNLCVLCGRCVRICNEERNSGVLAFVQRGNTTLVGTAFLESQKDAGCEYCGACVDVCPTGSIAEKMGGWVGAPDKSTITTCTLCPVGCQMNVNTRGNRIINVGPEPGKRTAPLQLCVRGKFVPGDIVHHPDRITKPVIKKENKWVEIAWDDAIRFITKNLEKYKGSRFGMIGSAQDSIENNYILQKFTRKVMKSNNVDLLFSYPGKNLLKKIHEYYNAFPPIGLNKIESADTIFVIGSQAYSSHPIVENRIRKAYNNGKQVVVAHTHYTRTVDFSNLFVNFNPGQEYSFLSMLMAYISVILKKRLPDSVRELLENSNQRKLERIGGFSIEEIEQFARKLVKSEKILIIVGEWILRSPESEKSFNLLINISRLLGGLDNNRLLFLLDEGNRYGGTLVGMHPDYFAGFDGVHNRVNRNRWSGLWNTKLPHQKGLSANEMIKNISNDGIRALFVMGDMPPHKNLSNLEFMVQQNMFLSQASDYADIVLPLSSFTETEGHIIDVERSLKKFTPVIKPSGLASPAWATMQEIAEGMQQNGFGYKSASMILSEIKSVVDLSFSTAEYESKRLLSVNRIQHRKSNKFPVQVIIEPNHFHYMGNLLSALIPDMAAIREEGVLFVSEKLLRDLTAREGEKVRLITSFGKKVFKVMIMPGLNGKVAYIKPAWNDLSLFSDGLSPEKCVVNAKIEDVD